MISLKGIKVYEGMSEETHCFEANLYVDNKKLGRVSNSRCSSGWWVAHHGSIRWLRKEWQRPWRLEQLKRMS